MTEFSILCYSRKVLPYKALQYQLITEIIFFSILYVESFVTSAIVTDWFTNWGGFPQITRVIVRSLMCVPHIVYSIILRCRFDDQLVSGKIIKSFDAWRNWRLFIFTPMLFIHVVGTIHLVYVYLNNLDDQDFFESEYRYTRRMFIFEISFGCLLAWLLIWTLWKVIFIDNALLDLKNSDEFHGEYFDESSSNSSQHKKKQEEEEREKYEQEEKKQKQKEDQLVHNEIAVLEMQKYKHFDYLKKPDHKGKDSSEIKIPSDSEIYYQNMCQLMHPSDFLALKKQKLALANKSLSLNDLDSIDVQQYGKITKKKYVNQPNNKQILSGLDNILKDLDNSDQKQVIESFSISDPCLDRNLAIVEDKIAEDLADGEHADDVIFEGKQPKRTRRNSKANKKKNIWKEKNELGSSNNSNFKKMKLSNKKTKTKSKEGNGKICKSK